MRPLVGGDAATIASQKQGLRERDRIPPGNEADSNRPTTFFLATESMMNSATEDDRPPAPDDSYGVQSLEESREGASLAASDDEGKLPEVRRRKRRSTAKAATVDHLDASTESLRTLEQSTVPSSPPRWEAPKHVLEADHHQATPRSLGSFFDASLSSSPKSAPSVRTSDEDVVSMTSSQGLIYSGDDEAQPREEQQDSLELIMPSIMLPTRRPFTDRGKALGQLRILVAGARGSGKTSLIKSIVQTCKDIVHVDVPSTRSPAPALYQARKTKVSTKQPSYPSTSAVYEIYASSKPYPSWWCEMEESVLRRRRSSGEIVLERNICFVDTPGCRGDGIADSAALKLVQQYLEARSSQMAHPTNLSEAEMMSLLGGSGGGHVDVALYLVDKHLESSDLEYIRYLDTWTNVVVLISKSDLLTSQESQHLKDEISSALQSAGLTTSDISRKSSNTLIFSTCSSPSTDDENMDASLLMSPHYIHPLQASELSLVVEKLFSSDCASWLKHSAARKVIRTWNSRATATVPSELRITVPQSPTPPSLSPRSPPSSWDESFALIPRSPGQLSYSHARSADFCRREERLAQIHLANWASNLQKSLRQERWQYERLARADQARWLRQRVEESSLDINDIAHGAAISSEKGNVGARSSRSQSRLGRGLVFASDPLGLMRMNDAFWKHGWTALQALGAFGLLGAAALWVVRGWAWTCDGGFHTMGKAWL